MQKYKQGASLKHYYSPVQQLKCHKGFFILLHFHLCNTCKIYLNISDTKIWPKAKCHDRLSSTSGLFGQTTRLHIKDLRSWKHQLNVVMQLQSLCDILNKRGGGAALFSLDVQIKTSSLKSSRLRAGPPNNGYLHSFQLFRKSSLSASEKKIIIRRKQSSFGAHTQMQHAVVLNHRTLLITEGGNTKRWKQTLCHGSGCNEAICQQTNNHFKSTDINCFATAVLLRKLFYFFWWPSLFLLVSPQLSGYSLQSLVRLSEFTRHD